jgi:hypothetical protein
MRQRETDTHHLANRILSNEEDKWFCLNVSVRQRRRKKVVVAVVLFQREKRPAAHHLRTYASALACFPHPPMLDANAHADTRKQMRKERDQGGRSTGRPRDKHAGTQRHRATKTHSYIPIHTRELTWNTRARKTAPGVRLQAVGC